MEQLANATTGQIVVYFNSHYAPCGFLVCRVLTDEGDYDPYSEDTAVTFLSETDWDWPGVASTFGHPPCHCGATDGTVDCDHKTASEMISEAYDYLRDINGRKAVDDPGYFTSEDT